VRGTRSARAIASGPSAEVSSGGPVLSDGETVLAPEEDVEAVLAKIAAAEAAEPRAGEALPSLPRGFIELATSKGVLALNVAGIVSLRRS